MDDLRGWWDRTRRRKLKPGVQGWVVKVRPASSADPAARDGASVPADPDAAEPAVPSPAPEDGDRTAAALLAATDEPSNEAADEHAGTAWWKTEAAPGTADEPAMADPTSDEAVELESEAASQAGRLAWAGLIGEAAVEPEDGSDASLAPSTEPPSPPELTWAAPGAAPWETVDLVAETESEQERDVEPMPEPGSATEPEPTPEPEPEPEGMPEPEPTPEFEPDAATESEPETEPEPVSVPAAEPEPEATPAPEPDAEPEPEAEPAPAPAAVDPWAGITWSAADQPAPWSPPDATADRTAPEVPDPIADPSPIAAVAAAEASADPTPASPPPTPSAPPATPAAAPDDDGRLRLDDDQRRWLGRNVELVEGIGPAYGRQLESLGIVTLQDLLLRGATRRGRQEIADRTGISGKLILRWVNNADLFRIRGVGTQFADLLEAAGVDTVVELALRRPENLVARLQTTNEIRSLVRQVPSEVQVADWIAQAKELPRIVAY